MSENEHSFPTSPEHSRDVVLPQEGEIVELNGKQFRFVTVPTGKTAWDSDKEEMIPVNHTLKTWFAHSDELGPGPGWDLRQKLVELNDEEMLVRYGHVFTPEEITFPSGSWEVSSEGEELVGGMPNDIPYFDIEPSEGEQE